MCQFDNSANQVLDDVIAARRTNRMFLSDIPPKEQISEIIKAGLAAPFAAALPAVEAPNISASFSFLPMKAGA